MWKFLEFTVELNVNTRKTGMKTPVGTGGRYRRLDAYLSSFIVSANSEDPGGDKGPENKIPETQE